MSARARTPLRTDALTDPINLDELSTFGRTLPRQVRPGLAGPLALAVITSASLVVLLVIFATVIGGEGWNPIAILLVAPLAVMALIPWGFVAITVMRRRSVKEFRLTRFAADNALTYEAVTGPLDEPGVLFGLAGAAGEGRDVLRGTDGWAFGHYVVDTAAVDDAHTGARGRHRGRQLWGFAIAPLAGDAPSVGAFRRVTGASPARTELPLHETVEQVELAGEPGSEYIVWSTPGHDEVARAIFTPEIITRLAAGPPFNVELGERRVVLSARGEIVSLDPERWQHLGDLLRTVVERVASVRLTETSEQ